MSVLQSIISVNKIKVAENHFFKLKTKIFPLVVTGVFHTFTTISACDATRLLLSPLQN